MDSDTQFWGIGKEVTLDARKLYEPGGRSQMSTNVYSNTMTRTGMNEVRPQITGSMNLREARLAYWSGTRNVTKEGRENFRMKVIRGGESDTPGSSPTTITDHFM